LPPKTYTTHNISAVLLLLYLFLSHISTSLLFLVYFIPFSRFERFECPLRYHSFPKSWNNVFLPFCTSSQHKLHCNFERIRLLPISFVTSFFEYSLCVSLLHLFYLLLSLLNPFQNNAYHALLNCYISSLTTSLISCPSPVLPLLLIYTQLRIFYYLLFIFDSTYRHPLPKLIRSCTFVPLTSFSP
jgi:hypothetical protein